MAEVLKITNSIQSELRETVFIRVRVKKQRHGFKVIGRTIRDSMREKKNLRTNNYDLKGSVLGPLTFVIYMEKTATET